jgi:uncharacterized protein (DUF58 family)
MPFQGLRKHFWSIAMEFGKKHVLVWGSFFLLVVGMVLAIRQIYVMFAALALLAPCSYLLSRRSLDALLVWRDCPGVMKEGQERRVRLRVTNEAVRRRYFFTIEDEIPEGLEAVGQGRRLVPSLASGEEVEVAYTLRARRRGVYKVGPARLGHSDLLGLYSFRRAAGEADELVVHPTPERLPERWARASSLRARQRPRRRFRGEGTEFYGVRRFVPGDDLRRVDWKSTARRAQLTVREYERAEALDCVVALDLARSEHRGKGDDSTLERGVKLAASVAAHMLERGSSAGLVAAGAEEFSIPSSADPRQKVRIFDALARVKADGTVDFAEVLTAHRNYLPPGCLVVGISPGLRPELVAAAVALQRQGYAVGWIILEARRRGSRHPWELTEEQLAARMTQQGVPAHIIEPGRELAASMRRAYRAAG